jgi:SAM-dependent methyltransferase
MAEPAVKERVRAFYDSVGWKQIGENLYQNARYEDLRPVARVYIHRCHLRVARHLPRSGDRLLDAGSGPIQYPEYLEYSRGYSRRVCLDISVLALREARARIGDHGLYVVGDIAALPFREGAFGGVVSLHTVHHLPGEEHARAFEELHRVLASEGSAAVVYTWGQYAPLMRMMKGPMRWVRRAVEGAARRLGRAGGSPEGVALDRETEELLRTPGTFTTKHDYAWVKRHLSWLPGLEIRVWRSVSPAFMRAMIHPLLLGRFWLWLLYKLEELAPHLFGRIGQYPMILFSKRRRAEAPGTRTT